MLLNFNEPLTSVEKKDIVLRQLITKTFNQNLPIVLSLHSDTIGRTQEDKKKFIQLLVDKDKDNELSEYIWNGINFFDEIYKNEMNLPK